MKRGVPIRGPSAGGGEDAEGKSGGKKSSGKKNKDKKKVQVKARAGRRRATAEAQAQAAGIAGGRGDYDSVADYVVSGGNDVVVVWGEDEDDGDSSSSDGVREVRGRRRDAAGAGDGMRRRRVGDSGEGWRRGGSSSDGREAANALSFVRVEASSLDEGGGEGGREEGRGWRRYGAGPGVRRSSAAPASRTLLATDMDGGDGDSLSPDGVSLLWLGPEVSDGRWRAPEEGSLWAEAFLRLRLTRWQPQHVSASCRMPCGHWDTLR